MVQAARHPTTTNDAVAAMFHERTELHALAVVDGTQPVALINRQQFMNHYATLYFREVRAQALSGVCQHGAARGGARLRCGAAHGHPHIARPALPERRLHRDGQRPLHRPGHGRPTGARRDRNAHRSGPPRQPAHVLPGNIPISLHMQRLLDNGTEFVACYADLNHFKPLQRPLRLLARRPDDPAGGRLATMHCDARRDFVGHVGGDDFMLIFQSSNWRQRCKTSSRTLDAKRWPCLTNQPGGLAASTLKTGMACAGSSVHHPGGGVHVTPGRFRHAEEVANVAATVKPRSQTNRHRRLGCYTECPPQT